MLVHIFAFFGIFRQRKKRKCLGNIPISNWKFILLKERDFWQWTEEVKFDFNPNVACSLVFIFCFIVY